MVGPRTIDPAGVARAYAEIAESKRRKNVEMYEKYRGLAANATNDAERQKYLERAELCWGVIEIEDRKRSAVSSSQVGTTWKVRPILEGFAGESVLDGPDR